MAKHQKRDHQIHRWRANDLEALRRVAMCGHGNLEDFRDLRISAKRVKDMTRSKCGILEKVEVSRNIKGVNHTVDVYRLTRKGCKFVDRELGISHSMRTTSKTYTHNEKLRETIEELEQTEKKIKRIWNERELLKRFKDEIKDARVWGNKIGVTDAMVEFEDGTLQCIEVISKYYTQEIIDGKCNFAAMINAEIQLYRS